MIGPGRSVAQQPTAQENFFFRRQFIKLVEFASFSEIQLPISSNVSVHDRKLIHMETIL